MDNIFLYHFSEKIEFLTAPLWFPKERDFFMSVALLLSFYSSSVHAEMFYNIFLILV